MPCARYTYSEFACNQGLWRQSQTWPPRHHTVMKQYLLLLYLFIFLLFYCWQYYKYPPIFPLYPPPPSPCPTRGLHHTLVGVHGLRIYVCKFLVNLFPALLPPSEIHQSILWAHASGPILFASLFCTLDCTYKWDHVIFICHFLAGFFHLAW